MQKSYKQLGREAIIKALNNGKMLSEIKVMKKPKKEVRGIKQKSLFE